MKRIVVAACVVMVAVSTAACALFRNGKNAYVVAEAEDGSGVVITGYRGTEKDLMIPATIKESPSWKSDFRRFLRVFF